jgi:WD40 repeat protein
MRSAGEAVFVLKGHSRGVTSVAFSPDGKRNVSGSRDNTVRVLDNSALPNPTSIFFKHIG